MKRIASVTLLLLFTLVLNSCKEDKSAKVPDPAIEQQRKVEREQAAKAKAEAEEARTLRINSVFSKLMVTPEAKTFTRAAVSVGLGEALSAEEGPFTIFAPSDQAFEKLGVEGNKVLTEYTMRTELEKLIKMHVVSGQIDSITMTQNARTGNGSFPVVTMSGDTLIASKKGMDIILKDKKGSSSVLVKSDILGSNGIVHIVDKVLGVQN